MLEKIMDVKALLKSPVYAVILGFMYSLIGSQIAFIFFGRNLSLVMIFMTTLLLDPSLMGLMNFFEHQDDRLFSFRIFLKNNRKIFAIFVCLFIGVFTYYAIMGAFLSEDRFNVVFGAQSQFFNAIYESGPQHDYIKKDMFITVLNNNLLVNMLFFGLSFFFGMGSIFLIVYNGSIFAVAVTSVIRDRAAEYFTKLTYLFATSAVFFIHMIPEVAGFLLTSIAGVMASDAIIKKKFKSIGFRNLMQNAFILFTIGNLLIVLAAFLEIYVTKDLFFMLFMK
jgi:uncharacterized membrane protein SpoIIM required for sporulation